MPNKRKVKARESARNDNTPVKPSSSHSRPRPITGEETPSPAGPRPPLRTTVCEAGVNQDSPEQLLFSPSIKPTQNDIEWAWKSPIGRSHADAGPGSKRRLQSKTPVQKTKRGFKVYSPDSPIANLPSKRKLIKHENEGIEYLSTLTSQLQALTEHCDNRSPPGSVTSRAEERNDEAVSPIRRSDEAEWTTRRSFEAVPTTTRTEPCVRVAAGCPVTEAKNVSSLTALLEDDDGFDLFQCSQFIEEKLTENPDKVIFSPIQLNGGSRICSAVSRTDRLAPILMSTNGKSRKCSMVNDTPTSTLMSNHGVARNCLPVTDKLERTLMSTNGMARKCPAASDRTLSMAMPTNSGSRKSPLVTTLPTSVPVPNKEIGVACTLPVDTLVNNNSKVNKVIMTSKLLPNMCRPKQANSGQVVDSSVDRTGKCLQTSSKGEPISANKCFPKKAAQCPTQNKEFVTLATEQKPSVLRPAYSQEKNAKTENSSTSEIDDDSFDAVLLSFCDQNFELLSKPAKGSFVEPKSSLVPQTAASRQICRPTVATATSNKTANVLDEPKSSILAQPQTAASRQICRPTVATATSNKTANVLDEPKSSILPQPQTAASRQRCKPTVATATFNKTVSVLVEPESSILAQPQTAASRQRCTSTVATATFNKTVKVLDEPKSSRPILPQPCTASNKTMNASLTKVCESRDVYKHKEVDAQNNCKDEDFLQPELLNILESIETSLGQKSVSSGSLKCTPEPLKCTPEEIEMKRVQARLKLQRKKRAMLDGICRLPNPYLKGKLQS